jgi:hypothetical protein
MGRSNSSFHSGTKLPYERKAQKVYNSGKTPVATTALRKVANVVGSAGRADRAPVIGRRIDMAIRPGALDSAIASPTGEFETTHSLPNGGGKGQGYVEGRRRTEERMGYSQEFGAEGRPVYGFLNGPRLKAERASSSFIPVKYGQETVKFKRSVNKRSTFSMGDTNESGGQLRTRPVNRIRSSVKSIPSNRVINRKTPNEIKSLYDPKSTIQYVEAQIHGGAGLNDVKSITVGSPERAQQLQKKLAETGRKNVRVKIAKTRSAKSVTRANKIRQLRAGATDKLLGAANKISNAKSTKKSLRQERFENSPQGRAYRAAADKKWKEQQDKLNSDSYFDN